MEYRNCQECNKVFNYIEGPVLCKQCDKKLFDIIKDYLSENKNATVGQICEDTEIPLKIVRAFIKDKRLIEMRSGVSVCNLCGEILLENTKFCDKCMKKIKIISQLNEMVDEKHEPTHEGGMHYLNNGRTKK